MAYTARSSCLLLGSSVETSRLYRCRWHQRSHPPSRRLVLQTKTNDGLTLWGRTSPRCHLVTRIMIYRHTQVTNLAVVRLMQLSDGPSHLWTLRSCSSTTMSSWKTGSAKTSEEPRFLSPLEGFVGRNGSSRVVFWHLRRGKYRLEDPLSGLCLADLEGRSRKLDSGLYSRRRVVTAKILNRILVCKPLEQRCAIAVLKRNISCLVGSIWR